MCFYQLFWGLFVQFKGFAVPWQCFTKVKCSGVYRCTFLRVILYKLKQPFLHVSHGIGSKAVPLAVVYH